MIKYRWSAILYALFSAIAFILMTFLFWAQSIQLNSLYDSDLVAHISKALANGGTGYSLEGKLIIFFEKVTGGSTLGFCAVLSFIVVITPFAVGFFLSVIDKMSIDSSVDVMRNRYIGLWSIFTGPLVIPYLWFWFYKNTMNINAWHNSTSMEMRLFAVLALGFYFHIQYIINSGGHIRFRDWFFLAISLFISTWFKPSFFIGFAPVMAVWLLIDLISHRKDVDYIKKIIFTGCTVLPAGVMVIFQYWKLYGSREDVRLAINDSGGNLLYVIRVALFLIIPLTIFVYNRKKVLTEYHNGNRAYIQIWAFWALELLYHLLLTEVGRSGGNFGWGVRIGNYFVMLISVRLFWENALCVNRKRQIGINMAKREQIYIYVVGFLLIWEFICGLYYFGHLLVGGNYYI